jgi:hypothetical protein
VVHTDTASVAVARAPPIWFDYASCTSHTGHSGTSARLTARLPGFRGRRAGDMPGDKHSWLRRVNSTAPHSKLRIRAVCVQGIHRPLQDALSQSDEQKLRWRAYCPLRHGCPRAIERGPAFISYVPAPPLLAALMTVRPELPGELCYSCAQRDPPALVAEQVGARSAAIDIMKGGAAWELCEPGVPRATYSVHRFFAERLPTFQPAQHHPNMLGCSRANPSGHDDPGPQ